MENQFAYLETPKKSIGLTKRQYVAISSRWCNTSRFLSSASAVRDQHPPPMFCSNYGYRLKISRFMPSRRTHLRCSYWSPIRSEDSRQGVAKKQVRRYKYKCQLENLLIFCGLRQGVDRWRLNRQTTVCMFTILLYFAILSIKKRTEPYKRWCFLIFVRELGCTNTNADVSSFVKENEY